jgi:hypothetical protein
MNRLVITGLVLALACTAWAGGNPDVRCYIDFDPPNYVHAVTPEPYETIEAYVCLDRLGEGMTSVSLCIDNPDEGCPGCFASAAWFKLLPGDFGGNPPWSPDGFTVVSVQCMTDSVTLVGKIILFYLGGECCIRLLDHPNYPRWVADCGDPTEFDEYCVLAHGSIGGADCPDGDCEGVPVEDGTWGMVKSLYR